MNINETYSEHKVFNQLTEYAEFYDLLSFSTSGFVTQGTKPVFPFCMDSAVFRSMQGTLESIKNIFIAGQINDGYALLRKYYDVVVINVYTILYLSDNFNMEDNFIVKEINDWVEGVKKLPTFKTMLDYIKSSAKLKELNDLLLKDNAFREIKNRCNDHIHYNFYACIPLNFGTIRHVKQIKILNDFSGDLQNLFILHLSYLFYLNDHYMISSDYTDHLDCGLPPPENAQYFVASYIQEIFDNVIKKNRPDLAAKIKENTCMQLT